MQDTWWRMPRPDCKYSATATQYFVPATAAPTLPRLDLLQLIRLPAAPRRASDANCCPAYRGATRPKASTPDTRPARPVWLLFEDTNGNGSVDTGEKLIAGSCGQVYKAVPKPLTPRWCQ